MLGVIIGALVGGVTAVALNRIAEAYVHWEHAKATPSRPYAAFLAAWESLKAGVLWAFSKARITRT